VYLSYISRLCRSEVEVRIQFEAIEGIEWIEWIESTERVETAEARFLLRRASVGRVSCDTISRDAPWSEVALSSVH
jgi:hypothetical protein